MLQVSRRCGLFVIFRCISSGSSASCHDFVTAADRVTGLHGSTCRRGMGSSPMHADPTAVGNLYGMVVDEQPSPRCVLIPLLPSLLPAGLLLLLALGLVHVSCWPSLWTGC